MTETLRFAQGDGWGGDFALVPSLYGTRIGIDRKVGLL